MAVSAFIPLGIFIVILGVVGLRLVSLWRRTRELPELLLGGGLLVVSLSMPFSVLGRLPATAMTPLGRVSFSLGLLAVAAGISMLVCFNYYVFRRGVGWGRVFAILLSAALFAAVVYMSIENFQGESVQTIKRAMRPGTFSVMGSIVVCFGWGGCESFGWHRALRQQMKLGLGDAVVANRFWLWGLASIVSSALVLVLISCVMAGMTILREPLPLMAIAGAGTVMSASWYLTFFAPDRYQRVLRERAASAAPS